jgi:hypothetical protein
MDATEDAFLTHIKMGGGPQAHGRVRRLVAGHRLGNDNPPCIALAGKVHCIAKDKAWIGRD